MVFTVSRPIAAASHLSQGVLWVNVDGGVFSEVTGAGRWIGSHFCHARQVRFEKGDMRASVRLETHCNGVIGAGGTVRAILDDGLSSYCEDSHDWEPVATVTGSPGRATVAATDSETADWTVALSPASTAKSDAETVRSTVSIANYRTDESTSRRSSCSDIEATLNEASTRFQVGPSHGGTARSMRRKPMKRATQVLSALGVVLLFAAAGRATAGAH